MTTLSKQLETFNLGTSATPSDLSPLTVSSTLESPAPRIAPLASANSIVEGTNLTRSEIPSAVSDPPLPDVNNLPPPPPEVQMLLDVHTRKGPVAPLVSRSSPIIPWVLPDEIGCIWSGLFTIESIEVRDYSLNTRAESLRVD